VAVSWLPAASPAKPLFAFAIAKTVGNAVVRNRLRRRMKEALRLDESLPGGAYLVRAQPAAATLDFSTLRDNLRRATDGATRQARRAGAQST
jgi:ribonuclease P protein component